MANSVIMEREQRRKRTEFMYLFINIFNKDRGRSNTMEERKKNREKLSVGTICISSGSGRRSIYKMAGGYLSERSGSFDYNTGSISVSVSGKPWGCIWNPAESADCICSWSIVDFFCGRLHLRENSAEKKICSVKSMCDPSGIRRHRKSDRSSGKELRSGFLLFQPD